MILKELLIFKGLCLGCNLVKDELINAWHMPGGKIVFYLEILPISQNDDRISIFMGYKVARALSENGGQRISAGLRQNRLGLLLNKTSQK